MVASTSTTGSRSVKAPLPASVLGGAARATYGDKLIDRLGEQLAQEFGRGFESRNLRRMVKLAEAFSDTAILSTLSSKLSWSHMVIIVALKTGTCSHAVRTHIDWSLQKLTDARDLRSTTNDH